jgi:hypothetical protein
MTVISIISPQSTDTLAPKDKESSALTSSECRSRESPIKNQHILRRPIWIQCHVIKHKSVLPSISFLLIFQNGKSNSLEPYSQ